MRSLRGLILMLLLPSVALAGEAVLMVFTPSVLAPAVRRVGLDARPPRG